MKAYKRFSKLGFFKTEDEEEIKYFRSKITETDYIIFDKKDNTVRGYTEEHPFCKMKELPIDIEEVGAILTQLSELERENK